MMKCRYAGDVNDEYCKNCDGVKMEVDGKELSCEECAGYEPGEDLVEESNENECMNPPEEPVEDKEESKPAVEQAETTQKQAKNKKSTNNTASKKTPEKKKNNVSDKKVKKVSEEKKVSETAGSDGVKVVSLRYTSSATVKKGDNYFKFTAEEEWDVSQVDSVEDVREMLWVKLNGEVDKQIEELQNM